MKNLKQTIDTAAVVINDLLNFKLTKWSVAKEKAAEMHEAHAKGTELPEGMKLVDELNDAIETPRVRTPLGELMLTVTNYVAVAVVGWALFKVVMAVSGVILVTMLALFVLGAIKHFADKATGKARRAAAPAPAAV